MNEWLAALVLLAATGACAGDDSSPAPAGVDSGPPCPNDLPTQCPTPSPTYAKDIAPVIQQSCTPCHTAGGREEIHTLTDYDGLFAERGAALRFVAACRMPLRGAPPLSPEGRRALLGWLVCGAKND